MRTPGFLVRLCVRCRAYAGLLNQHPVSLPFVILTAEEPGKQSSYQRNRKAKQSSTVHPESGQ